MIAASAGLHQVALVDGVPRTLTLKQFLQHFLDFRVDVVERRARHRCVGATAHMLNSGEGPGGGELLWAN